MKEKKCSICSSLAKKKFSKTNILNKFEYYWCNACNFLFVYPTPNKEEIKFYYENIFELPTNQKDKVLKKIKFLFENYKFNNKEKRILEIGSGEGHALKYLKNNNFKVYGVETNNNSKNLEKLGIKMHIGDFEKIGPKLNKNYFDIIILFDVIEHFRNPRKNLKIIKTLLKKEGKVIISTPNIISLDYKLLGKFWEWISAPGHLNYFSPKSLNLLLKQEKFKTLRLKTWKGDAEHSFILRFLIQLKDIPVYYLKLILIKFFKTKILDIIRKPKIKKEYIGQRKKFEFIKLDKLIYSKKNKPEVFVIAKNE